MRWPLWFLGLALLSFSGLSNQDPVSISNESMPRSISLITQPIHICYPAFSGLDEFLSYAVELNDGSPETGLTHR